MVTRDELTQFVEDTIGQDLLVKARALDVVANGVQLHGAPSVHKVALGVSLNHAFLTTASDWGAEFCIFHHGFDVRTVGSCYSRGAEARLSTIISNHLTIAGYHYSLDAQPEFGNNATIAKLLGAKVVDSLYDTWGVVAKLPEPVMASSLITKCQTIFNHEIKAFLVDEHTKVARLGIVSGAGKPYHSQLGEMSAKGVELYISGESSESRPHAVLEEGISYLLGGHYATEVFGVQELGHRIQAHYKNKLEVKFIDISNPL